MVDVSRQRASTWWSTADKEQTHGGRSVWRRGPSGHMADKIWRRGQSGLKVETRRSYGRHGTRRAHGGQAPRTRPGYIVRSQPFFPKIELRSKLLGKKYEENILKFNELPVCAFSFFSKGSFALRKSMGKNVQTYLFGVCDPRLQLKRFRLSNCFLKILSFFEWFAWCFFLDLGRFWEVPADAAFPLQPSSPSTVCSWDSPNMTQRTWYVEVWGGGSWASILIGIFPNWRTLRVWKVLKRDSLRCDSKKSKVWKAAFKSWTWWAQRSVRCNETALHPYPGSSVVSQISFLLKILQLNMSSEHGWFLRYRI